MKKLRWSAAVAVVAVVACGGGVTLPDGAPGLEGQVVGVGPAVPFGGPSSVWVKETPEAPCGVVFRTSEADILSRRPDGSIVELGLEDLLPGVAVRIWHGAVAESCPGQSEATTIEIMGMDLPL